MIFMQRFLPLVVHGSQLQTNWCRQGVVDQRRCRSGRGSGSLETENGNVKIIIIHHICRKQHASAYRGVEVSSWVQVSNMEFEVSKIIMIAIQSDT